MVAPMVLTVAPPSSSRRPRNAAGSPAFQWAAPCVLRPMVVVVVDRPRRRPQSVRKDEVARPSVVPAQTERLANHARAFARHQHLHRPHPRHIVQTGRVAGLCRLLAALFLRQANGSATAPWPACRPLPSIHSKLVVSLLILSRQSSRLTPNPGEQTHRRSGSRVDPRPRGSHQYLCLAEAAEVPVTAAAEAAVRPEDPTLADRPAAGAGQPAARRRRPIR